MKLGDAGERKIIKLIEGIVRKSGKTIADFEEDAAIFKVGKETMAVTIDMGSMSTHLLAMDARKIGKKIVTSNVTDLLAKGAVPEYMWVGIGLPPSFSLKFVQDLYMSMDRELKKYGAYVVGGDTNKAMEFVYSVTLVGKIKNKPLLRNSAKMGDYVVLTGEIGNAAAGCVALIKGLKTEKKFLKAQLSPEVDFKLCKKIIPLANAGIDISDGLGFELGEVSRLSNKKIVIYWDKLPVDKRLFKFCERNNLDIKDLIFHQGEDYQVVFTTPSSKYGKVIGRVERGSGVFLVKDGKEMPIEPRGYEHFISD